MSLLKTIDSPADLKRVPVEQLPALAEEIRQQIVSVTSAVGGHVASNLGVVELTVGLHYLLDTPKDKIVWDTSNQAYAHKLLTGRREHFRTLRQYGGLSGFCKREESIYDTFNAGHAGTGVSAAIGMAVARDLAEQHHKVVCVVGDGAMTSGMTLEAMQQVGGLQKDLLVILNDNQMSISRNVGSLSAYLNRTFTGEFVTHIREEAKHLLKAIPRVGDQLTRLALEAKHLLKAIPRVGDQLTRLAHRAEELAKGLVLPGVLFEELGFRYVGPIDGHNFEHLLPTLENVLKLKRPALLHVITKKGKGYEPAVKDAVWFHACSPFIRETGQPAKPSTKPSYTAVAIKTLCRLAREDRRIVAITAAMCEGTGLTAFQKEFPDRFHDVGIAEQHALTFAAGLATQGARPVVAMYSTFLQRAFDQVVHDVATQNLPATILIDRGGLVAEDGTTHHGAFDYAYLRHVPNMVVMAPKDENELQHMVKTCLSHEGPASVRYSRGSAWGVPLDAEPKALPIGRAELLREGYDVALVAIGITVLPALEAAERLADEGISAAVVNARFVKPLDHALIAQVARQVKCLVTVEEGCRMGGFGSAVLEALSDQGIVHMPTRVLGLPDKYIEQGPQDLLRVQYGLTADGMYEEAKALYTMTVLGVERR